MECSSKLEGWDASGNGKACSYISDDQQENPSFRTAGRTSVECSQVAEIQLERHEALESNSVGPKTDVDIASLGVLLEADALCWSALYTFEAANTSCIVERARIIPLPSSC